MTRLLDTLQIKVLTLKQRVMSLSVKEFGDKPGHPFRGNQWTTSHGVDLSKPHAVIRTGKGLGENIGARGHISSTHDTREEAVAKAKRLDALLSPGEKDYYKIRYKATATPRKETVGVLGGAAFLPTHYQPTDSKSPDFLRSLLGKKRSEY